MSHESRRAPEPMEKTTHYTGTAAARNGDIVPVSGKSYLHSRYDPRREAEQFAQAAGKGNFFIVLGIAGGYHIEALLERNPGAIIIAYEPDEADIDFLAKIPCAKNLSGRRNVALTTKNGIRKTITDLYMPAVHGNATITTLRAWQNAFPEEHDEAMSLIKAAIEDVSGDFSVQSHFGKIWQRNILLNLRTAAEIPELSVQADGRTAAIIAAGPTLDESCATLSADREKLFIVATDTAYRPLLSRGIIPDAVVSVDGQNVSYSHFIGAEGSRTIFVFDLCADTSAVRAVKEKGGRIAFVQTGHPLSSYASSFAEKPFPKLSTGSGTVTIAAADFASRCGFRRLDFYGADFAYTGGRPYARGTYLDDRFINASSRLSTSETMFDALMFRTELKETGRPHSPTTKILESYEKTLADFLAAEGFSRGTGEYGNAKSFVRDGKRTGAAFRSDGKFGFARFRDEFARRLEKSGKDGCSPEFLTTLPLAAWFAKRGGPVILAYDKTLGYTKKL